MIFSVSGYAVLADPLLDRIYYSIVLGLHIPRVKNRHISSILIDMHFMMMYTWQAAYEGGNGI